MSMPPDGLLKLITLTKQNKDIGPLLQDYVRRTYDVSSIAAFTNETIPGVDDKNALYTEWAGWIENGELERFRIEQDNAPDSPATLQPDEDNTPAGESTNADTFSESPADTDADADTEPPAQAEAPTQDAPSMPEAEFETPSVPDAPAPMADTSSAEPDASVAPAPLTDAEAEVPLTPPQDDPMNAPPTPPLDAQDAPSATAAAPTEASIDALVLAMVRRELATLPQPEPAEPPVSESRIREIVREELRTLLKAILS